MDALSVSHRIAELRPDTDPESVSGTLATENPRVVQFAEPLPDRLLAAVADALEAFPDVELRAYGRSVDPSLAWLGRFPHVRHLSIDLWHVTSFDRVASLGGLRKLALGETDARPSLAFLPALRGLEVLRLAGHAEDLAPVTELLNLRQLHLRASRAKTLEPLRSLELLEVVAIDFGRIRDLAPLADLPALQAVELHRITTLDTDDLEAIGDCRSLVALSLGALRNVTRLHALTRGPSRTLRYLTLDQMSGLVTLEDLASCETLEQVHLVRAKPKDGRLDAVARGAALRYLVVGDRYTTAQLGAATTAFRGDALVVRGAVLCGSADAPEPAVSWRRPVEQYLLLDED